jgi:hypothetical protein
VVTVICQYGERTGDAMRGGAAEREDVPGASVEVVSGAGSEVVLGSGVLLSVVDGGMEAATTTVLIIGALLGDETGPSEDTALATAEKEVL